MTPRTHTIRLDSLLAKQGFCSRRKAGEYLKRSYVTVQGERVFESGLRVNPEDVQVKGKNLQPVTLEYWLLNKPVGIVSTVDDELGRKSVANFIKSKQRLYPVGRLDKESSGLIIMTNDGELTNRLTHPKFHIPKSYLVTVRGKLTGNQIHLLENGVRTKHFKTAPAKLTKLKNHPQTTSFELTIFEGRNQQIRKMCKAINLELIGLKRTKIGLLRLDGLATGQVRELSEEEVEMLYQPSTEKALNQDQDQDQTQDELKVYFDQRGEIG